MTIDEMITEDNNIKIEAVLEIGAGVPIETEKVLERTIHKVEIIVKIEVGQDNLAPKQEGKKIEEIVIDEDQIQDPGPGLVQE